jgi:hypothetical protein
MSEREYIDEQKRMHERIIQLEIQRILQDMLDDPIFMHGNADGREEKIRHIAKVRGIELE